MLIGLSAPTFAQVSNEWVFTTPSEGDDQIRSTAILPDGSTLIAGYYEGKITVGDTSYQSQSFGHSGFVIKLDPNGMFLWSKEFRAIENFAEVDIFKIAPDPIGGFYIAGSFFGGSIDIDPGPDTLALTPNEDDILVAKFSDEGDLEWANSYILNSTSQERILDMDLDDQSNLYLVGYYDVSSGGNDDNMLLFSLNNEGEIRWVYTAEAEGRIDGFSRIDVYDNHAYITGEFMGSADFDPSDTAELIYESTENEAAMVIGKFQLDGSLVWMKMIKGDKDNYGKSIVVNELGDVIVGGEYGINTDFDPGDGVVDGGQEFRFDFSKHPFIVSLDNDGNFNWVWASNALDEVDRLFPDGNGGIYFGASGVATTFGRILNNGTLDFVTELKWEDSPNSRNANLKGLAYDGSGGLIIGVDYPWGFQYDPVEQLVLESGLTNDEADYNFAIAKYDISRPTSLLTHSIGDEISVFPNPINDRVFVQWKDWKFHKIDVIDMYGRMLMSVKTHDATNIEIPFGWLSGNYVLRLHHDEGSIPVKVNKL